MQRGLTCLLLVLGTGTAACADLAGGPSANCNTRGGSYQDGPYELECAASNAASRHTQSATIGIRCCADFTR